MEAIEDGRVDLLGIDGLCLDQWGKLSRFVLYFTPFLIIIYSPLKTVTLNKLLNMILGPFIRNLEDKTSFAAALRQLN